MKARPEFTVIAGPNGAGKSRLCPYYIHCKSFGGDLLAMN
jgi:ABC-type Mn2+/Zn2+ transport system ATPase subunit